MRHLVTIPLLLLAGYALICAVLYFKQDSLLFHPQNEPADVLDEYARQTDFEPWKNAKGERIGWQSKSGDPAHALLVIHGNGGFALRRDYTDFRRGWRGQLFLLEYPGYGARPGKVSAQSLVAAAVDAIDSLAASPGRRIWLFGESMGTGVSCAAAAGRPGKVAGITLLTPFDSLAGAAAAHYPWIPVGLLMRHRLDSKKNLEKFHGPVAFILAGRDETVPTRLGRKLYDSYDGPKRLWLIPEAGHNDFDELTREWPQIADWLVQASASAGGVKAGP